MPGVRAGPPGSQLCGVPGAAGCVVLPGEDGAVFVTGAEGKVDSKAGSASTGALITLKRVGKGNG